MLEPDVLAPVLHEYGYLPTQKPIAEGPYSKLLNSSIPYYEELVSLIPNAQVRSSIPEYPEIADHIRQAIDEVYYGVKEPISNLMYRMSRAIPIITPRDFLIFMRIMQRGKYLSDH